MHQNQIQKQFTCYFCNKLIQNESELGHTTICGNVLLPCPNKCGSYVPRMDLKKHKIDCFNKIITKSDNSKNYQENNRRSLESGGGGGNEGISGNSLDRKLVGQNTNMTETFIRGTQNELRKIAQKLTHFEEKSYQNSNILHQQIELYKNLQTQQRTDLENLKYSNQILNEWRKNVDNQLENSKQALAQSQKFQTETERNWLNFEEKFDRNLMKLQMDLRLQNDLFKNEQKHNRQIHLEFAEKIDEFRDWFTQENAVIGSLWNDQKAQIEKVRQKIDGLEGNLDDLKARYNSMIFDVKTVSQIASETAEKLEIQEREFREFRKELKQIVLDFANVEEMASNKVCNFGISFGVPGRILWRISDFAEKMQSAKESGTVLKSPIFYSHEYGYKLKILLHLNGLKKWKDRYALLSIYVMKGEYDQLLKWPCRIEGTATLRDLENVESPKNVSKFISAKYQHPGEDNEEPQESSSTYIFIPHTILTKSNFLKDDTVFFDIRIDQINKLVSETLL